MMKLMEVNMFKVLMFSLSLTYGTDFYRANSNQRTEITFVLPALKHFLEDVFDRGGVIIFSTDTSRTTRNTQLTVKAR